MSEQTLTLFRQEALDAKRDEWLGTIELAMPVSYRVLSIFSMMACVLLVVFLIVGRYPRREQVRGELVPSSGLLTTTTPLQGTLIRMLVKEGEAVSKGQVLAEISTELDSLSVGKTRAVISEELHAQRIRNAQALIDQEKLTAQKRDALKASIAIYRRQLQQLDAQLVIQTEQANSATALWQKFQSALGKGAVAGVQVEQQKSTALSAQSECNALKRQRGDIEQQLNVQEEQFHQLPLTAAAEYAELQQKLTDIDQALAKTKINVLLYYVLPKQVSYQM